MGLREEIKGYTDTDGLVSHSPTTPGQANASGNGILYTSLYYLTLARRSELTLQDKLDYTRIMKSCQTYPGCYTRGPTHSDRNTSVDDYVGLLAASKVLAPDLAEEVLEHGKKNFGVFNANPDDRSFGRTRKQFLWRQGQLVAHTYFACNKTPPWFFRQWWKLAIHKAMGAQPSDQDAWLLTWLLVVTEEFQNPSCDEMGQKWFEHTASGRQEWAQGICARTLSEGHPLGKYFIF